MAGKLFADVTTT